MHCNCYSKVFLNKISSRFKFWKSFLNFIYFERERVQARKGRERESKNPKQDQHRQHRDQRSEARTHKPQDNDMIRNQELDIEPAEPHRGALNFGNS